MAKTYAELRAMSVAELIEAYDSRTEHTDLHLGFYREEIARRDAEAATEKIKQMTRTMMRLTWVIAALTVVNVLLVACSVFVR